MKKKPIHSRGSQRGLLDGATCINETTAMNYFQTFKERFGEGFSSERLKKIEEDLNLQKMLVLLKRYKDGGSEVYCIARDEFIAIIDSRLSS